MNNDLSAHQGRGGGHVGADLGPVLGDLQGGEVRADLLQHHRGLRGETHADTKRVVENIAQPELSSIESMTKNDAICLLYHIKILRFIIVKKFLRGFEVILNVMYTP